MNTTQKHFDPVVDPALLTRLHQCTNLPSPPGVAARIIELGQDPTADLGMVADVVSLDPALAAKILRIANSPIYARQRKTDNLRQAIMMFGLNGTLTLALSFSLVSTLRAGKGDGLDYRLFWRRSLAAASCARALGVRLGAGSKEDLFLAGLLQDIGMLALDKACPGFYSSLDVAQSHDAAVTAAETAELGADHAAVGAWLLHSWNLPDKLVQAAAASHDPGVEVDAAYRPLADCMAVSAAVADIWWRDDHDQATADAAALAERLLGVTRESLAELLASLGEEMQETAALFDVDLGDAGLMESILEQAREVLMLRNLQSLQEAATLQQTTRSLESRTRELEEEARRDSLTGLHNRAYLDQLLDSEFAGAREHGWPLTVIFIDLDHFKQINDSHGHHAGDLVLRAAAGLLLASTRDSDLVARYGGEEFVIVLPGTGRQGATVTAERLVQAFRAARHDIGNGEQVGVTVAAGVAIQGEGAAFGSAADLMRSADQALYLAKQQGRDRWVMNEPDIVSG